MTNQKTHNSTPAKYNNSHIYCNYRQIPFTLYIFFFINFMFYPLCHTYIYISRVHTRKSMRGEGGRLLNKVVQDKKEGCLGFLMRHVKYCSSQALLSSGTVLKSAHGLFNIRQLHIILYNGNLNNDAFHTFNIKQGKPIQRHRTLTSISSF